MSKMLDMLKPFMEFEDPATGKPVVVCDPICRETRCMSTDEVDRQIINLDVFYDWSEPMWVFMQSALWCAVDDGAWDEYEENYQWALDVLHCPKCGAFVGHDENGHPYRIRFWRIVEALARRDRALLEIATKSPPDDWEWYEGAGVYAGYGRLGDPDYVEEPDPTNSDDMHSHGWICGQWSAAKIARKALAATEEDTR